MNITFILIVFVFGGIVFGIPTWNLARLQKRAHILWLIIPPVIVVSLFSLTSNFEGNSNPSWYLFFYHSAFYTAIFLIMMAASSLVWMIVGKIFRISNQKIFWLILISTLVYFFAARIHGEQLIVKEISLSAEYISRDYRFVHISDLQNNANRTSDVQKIVDKIQEADPEFVVITGDLIDSYFVTNEQMKPFEEIKVPIFLITGNHEYYLEEGKINKVIEETNILLIDGMRIQFDELDIIGVNELDTIEATIAKVGEVNPSRFTILLDHEPKPEEVARANEQGVDLMLSGHTHGGQVWPFGLLVQKLRYPYLNGLYTLGEMDIYVNPGTGTIGPKMRLGTTSEVTIINLKPTS